MGVKVSYLQPGRGYTPAAVNSPHWARQTDPPGAAGVNLVTIHY